jgi:enamine deaminase RidA (YjgF/YER057c/UK114 family)
MTRMLISQGTEFEAKIGYSRAVVVGDTIYVAGTTGYDYATMTISDDVAGLAP